MLSIGALRRSGRYLLINASIEQRLLGEMPYFRALRLRYDRCLSALRSGIVRNIGKVRSVCPEVPAVFSRLVARVLRRPPPFVLNAWAWPAAVPTDPLNAPGASMTRFCRRRAITSCRAA